MPRSSSTIRMRGRSPAAAGGAAGSSPFSSIGLGQNSDCGGVNPVSYSQQASNVTDLSFGAGLTSRSAGRYGSDSRLVAPTWVDPTGKKADATGWYVVLTPTCR